MTKRVALVTGATRGIGKAIALELAKAGNTVIGTATSEKGAAEISTYLSSFGGKGFVLNVTKLDEQQALLKQIKEEFGDIDILVNNAGITKDTLILRMKQDDWDAVINTNLTPIFQLSQAVIRPMMKNGFGRIINIGSVVGSTGNVGQVNYAAAKAGLVGFSKSLALEIGAKGVTVNVVAPGFIATDMTRVLSDEIKETIKSRIALKDLGQPEDIAATVGFLASDNARYITGQTIHVNGGMFLN